MSGGIAGIGVVQNEDVNSMTLLQLLQSFPDPPSTVTIDPSLFNSQAIKNIRASIVFPPISAPSLITNDGYTSISSPLLVSPQPSPPRASQQITSPPFIFPPQPLSLGSSSPSLSPSSANSLSTSNLNNPPLSPPLSHATLSVSTSAIPNKANGYSPPLQGFNSNLSGLRASAPVYKSPNPNDTIDLVSSFFSENKIYTQHVQITPPSATNHIM